MENLFLIASVSANVVTTLPFVIRKAKNCTLDDAWKLEKNYSQKIAREFVEYLTGSSFSPTSIGLLKNPEFVEVVREDWKKLSAVSIDALGSCEGFFTIESKNEIKGFQYIQIEFAGTPENREYFLVAVENHIRRQLQICQYPEPLVHTFSRPMKDNPNHIVCNFHFSSNEKEKQVLEQYISIRKERKKQSELQSSGLETIQDPELEKELEDV